ncbi:MAG: hypothetical protein ABI666_02930 [Ferruginibacter sp.]
MAKRYLFTIIIFMFIGLQTQAQFTSVSFSVQAHEDDWQLFMSSKIVADLNVSGRKMVFITLTAGDGSVGAGDYGPTSVPFFMARENGAVYSSKYVADITTGTTPLDVPTATTVSITGNSAHNITKYVYKNTVNYFLRLPDGNGNGSGFSNTGFVSLEKLKTGAIGSISALGSTAATYTGWSDLTNTIKAIINIEKITGTASWIYSAHTIDGSNTAYNPNDHSDHRYSSLAAQVAASAMTWMGVAGFMDYQSSGNGDNLSATDHENAAAIFAVANWGIIEAAYSTNFNSAHLPWIPMDYFLVIKTQSGTAPFAGTGGGSGSSELIKNDITDNTGNSVSPLTEIPMIISITSPVFIDKDISMLISPYEMGQLTTIVYDLSGNKIYDQTTIVTKRDALLITLQKAIKTKGVYIIKNILNNKFIETRKIEVK